MANDSHNQILLLQILTTMITFLLFKAPQNSNNNVTIHN